MGSLHENEKKSMNTVLSKIYITKEILRVKFEATFRLITYLFFDHLREDFFHQEIERKQVLYFWKQVHTYLLIM